MKTVVTGGAGFIGSHLVDSLVSRGHEVIVIDNHLSGLSYKNDKAKYVEKDITKDNLTEDLEDTEAAFHLAADPNVKTSAEDPRRNFELNVLGTFNVLEACRKTDVKHVVFTSTSTVYGEAEKMPTPEDYPCEPISNYGASKLAGEAYLSSYANSYEIKGTSLRYANIFGERSNHGVMFDFFHKLKKNPKKLKILGDGKQEKSYLHIEDCIPATLTAFKKQKKNYDIFNVGSREKTTVNEIAELVSKELNVSPEFSYTGGERGWIGDVPVMLLDVKKLEALGWKPKISFKEGVKIYISWLKSQS